MGSVSRQARGFCSPLPSIGGRLVFLVVLGLWALPSPAAALELVPEMQRPPGILLSPQGQLAALRHAPQAAEAAERFRERLVELWPQLREVDFVALSRHHVEATEGWRLPQKPQLQEATVIGREDTGRLHLEVLGPRLPARFEIVHRHVAFYTSFDPRTGDLGPLVVSIRGWIEE